MANLDIIRQDLTAATRGLRRAPGFAAAAVLTLTLGIGATATIFTVVKVLVLFGAMALLLSLGGLIAGVAASFVLARFVGGLLHGIPPHDPLTFAAVPCVLLAVAVLASFVPAWRATRVNPLTSLRQS